MNSISGNPICLDCGLCCNGVIFAAGQLQPGDDVRRLRELGLAILSKGRPSPLGGTARPAAESPASKFAQPCRAFDGCRCGIYAERPQYCRAFECRLLKDLHAGKVEAASARRVIRQTLRQAGKVKQLLRELGDDDEGMALSHRVRRTRRRLESGPANRQSAEVFADLTLAVHELNMLIRERFYPGD